MIEFEAAITAAAEAGYAEEVKATFTQWMMQMVASGGPSGSRAESLANGVGLLPSPPPAPSPL